MTLRTPEARSTQLLASGQRWSGCPAWHPRILGVLFNGATESPILVGGFRWFKPETTQQKWGAGPRRWSALDWSSDGPNSHFQYLWMQILHFNIRECEYYFHFYVYYFIKCDINWRIFYRLIIYYANKNIYCKNSAIKSLMEFWNLNPIPMCPLVTFGN